MNTIIFCHYFKTTK